MKNINRKILAALVLAGVLSIAGAAFADVAGIRGRDSSLIGDILHIIVNNDRPSHYHHHRAQTPPPPPEFKKGHRPSPFDGKRPPMSGDKRPPRPPRGDKRPPEPPREPKGFRPHMPPHHHPMARR